MKYIIATLGCKVNQYESEAMDRLLSDAGHIHTHDGDADAVILNSCAVTAEGERKARQTLRRLAKENPNAILCVCGCWSQIAPDTAESLGASVIFGTGDRAAFVTAVEEAVLSKQSFRHIPDTKKRRPIEDLPAGAYAGHARAYLKIEDGCDNFCSYCIIPYSRGRVCSLPTEKCSEQAAALAAKGYKEIVITGIEIASYGKDLEGDLTLADACEAVAAAAPGVRIHLGSLEPTCVTDDFINRVKKLDICPHFHLSLQSGCSETLKRMHRKYDAEEFFAVTQRLRSAFPECSLTADLITGFPGESEEEFEKTLQFLEKTAFAAVHVFPYSIRPGTMAEKLPQLPQYVKTERAAKASQVAQRTELAYLDSCIGKEYRVIFETEKNGFSYGHTDNYCEVRVEGCDLRSLVKNVKITGRDGKMLVGVLC